MARTQQLLVWASLIAPTILAFIADTRIPKRRLSRRARGIIITRKHMSLYSNNPWHSLNPESCQTRKESIPQIAKDTNYETAILDAWKEEEADAAEAWRTETRAVAYEDDDETPLYGHVIRKQSEAHEDGSLPGIIFFHTGAGPHDIFLLWKAASLVNCLPCGCVVLIADMLSDESGWAWAPDRERYDQARDHLLKADFGNNSRAILRKRIEAAMRTLSEMQEVDSRRLAGLGWCLGGHPVLELGCMRQPEIKALATFHGVFDGISAPHVNGHTGLDGSCEVLICHGVDDPFVPDEDLERALEIFHFYRHTTSLLQLKGAKHGFTNPAQDFNNNPSFGFNGEAAAKAWRQTLGLLNRRLLVSE